MVKEHLKGPNWQKRRVAEDLVVDQGTTRAVVLKIERPGSQSMRPQSKIEIPLIHVEVICARLHAAASGEFYFQLPRQFAGSRQDTSFDFCIESSELSLSTLTPQIDLMERGNRQYNGQRREQNARNDQDEGACAVAVEARILSLQRRPAESAQQHDNSGA